MAKIFLAWNTHRDESPVTEQMAERLKTVLEKKGHDVRIVEIPWRMSTWGHFTEYTKWAESLGKRSRVLLKKLYRKNPGAFIFDLNCTPNEKYFSAGIVPMGRKITRIKNWKARETEKGYNAIAHLQIFPDPLGRPDVWAVEFPAAYAQHPKSLGRYLHSHYVGGASEKDANLKASESMNFLSPLVVRKLAHLIDSNVNTRLKRYRETRGEKFKPKGSRKFSKSMLRRRRPM